MFSSSPDHKSLIRKNDKFYSRLLSKESSLQACPSFRVYYGVAPASVPFVWESQPGTPKHSIPKATIPPLAPPPSYDFHPKMKSTKKFSRPGDLFKAILAKLVLRKKHRPSSPTGSLSSASVSSVSSFSTMGSLSSRHSRFSSSRSLFFPRFEGEANGAIRRCQSMVTVKNALLSLVGHGSSEGNIA